MVYTADYLILGLREKNIDFVRFNTEDFPRDVSISLNIDENGVKGYFDFGRRIVDISAITVAWYRRPKPSNVSEDIEDVAAKDFVVSESKATLSALWRILKCFWVSHPDALRAAESKLYQLEVASKLGFLIPETCVSNIPQIAEQFFDRTGKRAIFKPQCGARLVRGETVSLIYTNLIEQHHAEHFDVVRYAPVLLQPYIDKKIELRVTVVGQQAFTAALHSQEIPDARHDWRRVDAASIRHEAFELPPKIARKCVQLVNELGLASGAIDLIVTPKDEYVFLEVNPNGQWAWIQQTCPEIRIREALIDLLVSGTSQ